MQDSKIRVPPTVCFAPEALPPGQSQDGAHPICESDAVRPFLATPHRLPVTLSCVSSPARLQQQQPPLAAHYCRLREQPGWVGVRGMSGAGCHERHEWAGEAGDLRGGRHLFLLFVCPVFLLTAGWSPCLPAAAEAEIVLCAIALANNSAPHLHSSLRPRFSADFVNRTDFIFKTPLI